MESGEPELALPKRDTTKTQQIYLKCVSTDELYKRVSIDSIKHLPRGDCIRFDAPRRRFVDGELLADESVSKLNIFRMKHSAIKKKSKCRFLTHQKSLL